MTEITTKRTLSYWIALAEAREEYHIAVKELEDAMYWRGYINAMKELLNKLAV